MYTQNIDLSEEKREVDKNTNNQSVTRKYVT